MFIVGINIRILRMFKVKNVNREKMITFVRVFGFMFLVDKIRRRSR